MAPKTRYELMTPADLAEAMDRAPVVLVPIGPIEWHGPHLPLGMDGLHARHIAERICAEVGGAVFPPLFLGTETLREPGMGPQQTGVLGLGDRDDIVGMDFPGFTTRSLYTEESAFGAAVRAVVRPLLATGWRLVVLVNGHGAVNHLRTLRRIAREERAANPGSSVVVYPAWEGIKGMFADPGHADRYETDVMLALEPESVDLAALPPTAVPLRYHETGIVDPEAFDGAPNEGFVVPPAADPRGSTRENGLRLVEAEVAAGIAFVRRQLDALG